MPSPSTKSKGGKSPERFAPYHARGFRVVKSTPEQFVKWPACILQLLFEPRRAVAISAGPGLRTIFVTAFAPIVRILHLDQLKILLPVRTLFLQRRGAIADFDPAHGLVGTNPRLCHVAQVFPLRDRPFAQRPALNGFQQPSLATILHPRSYQVPHTLYTTRPSAARVAPVSRSIQSTYHSFYGIRRILCSFKLRLLHNFCSSFNPLLPHRARNGSKHSSRDCSALCGYSSDSRKLS